MKIQCLSKNIKDAVLNAERSISKNQTLPVLNSLFIGVDKDKIKIRSTNLETALEIEVSGKIFEPGSVVVPAKTMGSFLSNILDEQISFQTQKNNLFIKTNTAQTIIKGLPQEDFPIFPKVEPIEKFTVSSPEFKSSLAMVISAASVSDVKPELSSVFFKFFKNTLKITATDSFRLAEKIISSKNIHTEKMISFMLPQKSAAEILKLLNNDEDIEVGISKNQIIFLTKSIKFISRLTEGVFPDYEQIIPKNFKTISVSKHGDILSHIKMASVFSGRLNDISIKIHPEKNSTIFSVDNSDSGEHSSFIASSVQGQEITARFNWRYVLDGVNQINNEYVLFSLNNQDLPMLIKGKGDQSYFYLVMPMRGG